MASIAESGAVVTSTISVHTAPHPENPTLAAAIDAVEEVDAEDLGVPHLQQMFEAILQMRHKVDVLTNRYETLRADVARAYSEETSKLGDDADAGAHTNAEWEAEARAEAEWQSRTEEGAEVVEESSGETATVKKKKKKKKGNGLNPGQKALITRFAKAILIASRKGIYSHMDPRK